MSEASHFQDLEQLRPNTAERKFWDNLKAAFSADECIAFFRYPMFRQCGDALKKPDVIFLHRRFGLWVFEVKGFSIEHIVAIEGAIWRMQGWHSEEETPTIQAEDGMYAIKSKLETPRPTRGLLRYHSRACLPFVTRQDLGQQGLDTEICCGGNVLTQQDIRPQNLKQHIQTASEQQPQSHLTDQQWDAVVQRLGGTLPSPEPRTVAAGTPLESPVRIIRSVEQQIKALDRDQLDIAYRYPDGPQRIRGLAGTGKTMLLCKRVAKMHIEHPDWQIAFVFYSRSLYDQALGLIESSYKQMLDDPDAEPNWSNVSVMHAWGARERAGFYRKTALQANQRPLSVQDCRNKNQGRNMSPDAAFALVCGELEAHKDQIRPFYDAIVIDEGQDLPLSFYRLAYAALKETKRLYWGYDEAQGIGSLIIPNSKEIFGSDQDGRPMIDLSGVYAGEGIRRSVILNRCYRTPRTTLMSAHALNMGLIRLQGALQGPSQKSDWKKLGYEITEGDFTQAAVADGANVTVTRIDAPHPLDQLSAAGSPINLSPLSVKTFDDENSELNWLARKISEDITAGLDPWDLMVTAPRGPNENEYFKRLQEQLARLHQINSVIAGVDTPPEIFRMDGHVTLASIFRSKGNEANKVYACRFQYATKPEAWREETEVNKRNEAFVALTRSKLWCVVSGVESVSPVFDELRSLIEQTPSITFRAYNKISLQRVIEDETDES